MQGLLIAISSSRKYFYIQTPYLLPTEPILMALKTAALAGVDIRIMIPERADTRLTHLASLSYLDDMMCAGVKIYLYQKGFLHSKLIVSDDTLSTVGSTNMDFRSFEHNFEVNAFMYDRTSALILKEIFLKDQKDAFLLQKTMDKASVVSKGTRIYYSASGTVALKGEIDAAVYAAFNEMRIILKVLIFSVFQYQQTVFL